MRARTPDQQPRSRVRRALRTGALAFSGMLAGALAAPPVLAQGTIAWAPQASSATPAPAAGQSGASPADAIRYMVERSVGGRHRVEVQVGQLDPRLQLAACGRVEPFLPPAVRLWGRTSIGMRCVDGANWSVLLPVTVRVFGQGLVAEIPLAAGTQPSAADFRTEEVDLAREPGTVVEDPAELAGKVLTRSISAGQALRREALRAPPVVASGDPVKLVVIGQGFTISGDGVAMGAAAEGQKLRVRTENGRVVTGELRGRTVELKL